MPSTLLINSPCLFPRRESWRVLGVHAGVTLVRQVGSSRGCALGTADSFSLERQALAREPTESELLCGAVEANHAWSLVIVIVFMIHENVRVLGSRPQLATPQNLAATDIEVIVWLMNTCSQSQRFVVQILPQSVAAILCATTAAWRALAGSQTTPVFVLHPNVSEKI